jgi:hypothetical protein
VPFRVRASDSSDKYFLVAHASMQDLLLCAKHLFVFTSATGVFR